MVMLQAAEFLQLKVMRILRKIKGPERRLLKDRTSSGANQCRSVLTMEAEMFLMVQSKVTADGFKGKPCEKL